MKKISASFFQYNTHVEKVQMNKMCVDFFSKGIISKINRFMSICLFMVLAINAVHAQTGLGDNFNQNKLSCKWTSNANYALTNTNSELKVVATNAGSGYNNFVLDFSSINLSANPVVSIKIRTTTAVTVRMDLKDINGTITNASPVTKIISNTGTYTTFTFDFTGKFSQSSPSNATVDASKIVELILFFNAGGSGYNGTVYMDDLQIGTGGASDGGLSACPLPISSAIRLNQIGFYPDFEKIAIVSGNPAAGSFYVRSLDLATTYFTGTLGATATWTFSNEQVRAADFSAFTTPGTYVLDVTGVGYSCPFKIDADVFNILSKTVLKGFYYKRASTAITSQYGGIYARAAGHPDTQVQIHASAASPGRPAGAVVSSPKGWYDAGDYGSYVVNSGISTFTLLSSYEHFKSYYDTLPLNIPESGNGTPDILNEIKWNLDWMLTMQDPYDGGVYHKKTTAAFDPFEMPSADQAQRYLIGKGSAATFDFAAVMAVAYRTYLPYNPTFANTCLVAAKSAYTWGIANPNVAFTNPGGISTGEYGDAALGDEKEWAATELYISTKNDSYYTNSYKAANTYTIPSWPIVNTLGLMSLVHHRKNLTAIGFADTTAIKNSLFAIANKIRTHKTTASAYKTGMGTNGNGDFIWGSNSVALNESMMCMASYLATNDITYMNTAISGLDYVLGRNATTYCLVSGLGSKPVMNPHDRISSSDGIVPPIPGWMAGGPNTDQTGDCGGATYPSTYKAASYVDNSCSYSTNEIAINWNAPLVFVGVGLQTLTSPVAAPVMLVSQATTVLTANNTSALYLGKGTIGIAVSPSTSITLKNTGNVPLTITSLSASPGFAISTLTPTSPIAAGASSLFTITATPTNVGVNTGTITIISNDATATFVLNVSDTGTAVPKPVMVVSQTTTNYTSNNTPSLDLGTATIGMPGSPVTTITLKNNGNAVLNVSSITASTGFAISTLSPASPIAAGASSTFTITATPTVVGANAGIITINSNDATTIFKLNVTVSGTPVPKPVMVVSQGTTNYTSNNSTALNLGTAVIGNAASPATSITIQNTGNAVLNVSSITASTGFVISTLNPASPIAAGASSIFTITATPTTVGVNTGTITINSNDATAIFKLNVNVSGTPVPKPVMVVSQGTTNYTSNNSTALNLGTAVIGNAASPATSITIQNTGNAVLNVSSITASTGFVISTLSPASPIAAGASSTFTITATPTVVGANAGTITINSNDAVAIFSLNVTVSGTPIPKPVMVVSQGTTNYTSNNSTALNLGTAVIGNAASPATSITIQNTGNAALNVSSITASTGFVISTLNPASPIAAGASSTFTITATPTVVGANAGTITINSNDAVAIFSLNVTVSGTPVPKPIMVVSQGTTNYTSNNSTALNLGTAVIGNAASPATSITIQNNGNAVLNISSITASTGFSISALSPASSIAAGASSTFTITAIPNVVGANAGVITINSNDATAIFKLNVTVAGTAVPKPILVVYQAASVLMTNNSPALDLGAAVIGNMVSPTTTITINNNGNAVLNVASISASTGFAISTLSPASHIAAGSSSTFTITATPTNVGANAGIITINSNDAMNGTFILNVNVTGNPTPKPAMVVSQAASVLTTNNSPSLDLGSAVIGNAVSPTTTITIKNNGNAVLNVTSIVTTSGFVLSSLTPVSSIAAGASSTFAITATPTNVGANAGIITINSNDAINGTFILNVNVTGNPAPKPLMVISQATSLLTTNNSPSLDLGNALIGNAASPTTTITIQNAGNATLTVTSITATTGFVVSALTPISPIAAGTSSTFTITATPVSEGLNSGAITIKSNDATSTFILNVSVTGSLALTTMAINQGSTDYANNGKTLVFSPTIQGAQTPSSIFTITNTGSATLNLSTPIVTGPYKISGPISTALAPSATTTFLIIFQPISTGVFKGSVEFPTNITGSKFTLNLSGTGTLATGTVGKLSDNLITIHPNPSNGETSVQLDGSYTNISIRVFNALGQQIISNEIGDLNNTTFPLSLGNNASGIYFLEILSEQGTSLKRLIKE
jgi:hypothetical protein